MRIGLSSVVGDGFGSGAFSFGEVPSGGGGCPAAGTPTGSTVRETYSSGSNIYVSELNEYYYNQDADFNVLNDGTCGTYVSYSTASNIAYKPNSTLIAHGYWYDYTSGSTVSVLGTDYYAQQARNSYYHDGAGGYSESLATAVQYKAADTLITSEPEVEPVPEVGGSNYSTGRLTDYYHNGAGGVSTSISGNYHPAGTLIWQTIISTNYLSLPSGSTPESSYSGTRYEWDGTGNYSEYMNWYIPYGTFIEEFSGYNYYHDGNNGYYTVPV